MSNAFWRSLPQGAFADLSRTALGNLFLVPPSVGIIRLSEVTQAKDAVVFDCAAGSGMVGSLIFGMEESKGKNVHVLFGDIGQAGIDTCKKRIQESGWNAKADIVDAQDTKLPDNHFTHVLINYGVQLFPEPKTALIEMHRILRPGGTLAFSSHNHIGWLPIVEAACKKLALPALAKLEQMRIWNDDSWLPKLQELGFKDARLEWMENPITIQPEQDNDFANMCGMMWPQLVPADWSEKDKNRKDEVVNEVKAYLVKEREKGDVLVRMAGPLFVGHKAA